MKAPTEKAPVADKLRYWSVPDEDGCLIWTRWLDRYGYGWICSGGRRMGAHRAAYLTFVGPIPGDLQVDHLCFKPACVNPEHLRLLTLLENARNLRRARKTHCDHGHEFTPENTVWQPDRRNPQNPNLHRSCRTCRRASDAKRRAARKAAA